MSHLGIHFLDKFKIAVDYHSIVRVLDLLWVAVGVSISIYIIKKEMSSSEIMESENHIYLKVLKKLKEISKINNL